MLQENNNLKSILIESKLRNESIDKILSKNKINEQDLYKELKTFNVEEIPEEYLEKIQDISGDRSFFYTESHSIDVSCASFNYVVEYAPTEESFKESFAKLSLIEEEEKLKIILTPNDLIDKYKGIADIEGIKLISEETLNSNNWIW